MWFQKSILQTALVAMMGLSATSAVHARGCDNVEALCQLAAQSPERFSSRRVLEETLQCMTPVCGDTVTAVRNAFEARFVTVLGKPPLTGAAQPLGSGGTVAAISTADLVGVLDDAHENLVLASANVQTAQENLLIALGDLKRAGVSNADLVVLTSATPVGPDTPLSAYTARKFAAVERYFAAVERYESALSDYETSHEAVEALISVASDTVESDSPVEVTLESELDDARADLRDAIIELSAAAELTADEVNTYFAVRDAVDELDVQGFGLAVAYFEGMAAIGLALEVGDPAPEVEEAIDDVAGAIAEADPLLSDTSALIEFADAELIDYEDAQGEAEVALSHAMSNYGDLFEDSADESDALSIAPTAPVAPEPETVVTSETETASEPESEDPQDTAPDESISNEDAGS